MASMFKDINLSKDLMEEFKGTAHSHSIKNDMNIDFVVEVLTNGHWPELGNVACILPTEMKNITIKFE